MAKTRANKAAQPKRRREGETVETPTDESSLQPNVEFQWLSFLRVDLAFDGFVPVGESESERRSNPDADQN